MVVENGLWFYDGCSLTSGCITVVAMMIYGFIMATYNGLWLHNDCKMVSGCTMVVENDI